MKRMKKERDGKRMKRGKERERFIDDNRKWAGKLDMGANFKACQQVDRLFERQIKNKLKG